MRGSFVRVVSSKYDQIARLKIRRLHTVSSWRSRPVILVSQRQGLSTDTFINILTPPAVFGGLVVVLWAYKCLMLVLFQNKIIYMPSVPPFSRRERINDYETACLPVKWRKVMIKSLDGTPLALCVGETFGLAQNSNSRAVVLYFQG